MKTILIKKILKYCVVPGTPRVGGWKNWSKKEKSVWEKRKNERNEKYFVEQSTIGVSLSWWYTSKYIHNTCSKDYNHDEFILSNIEQD